MSRARTQALELVEDQICGSAEAMSTLASQRNAVTEIPAAESAEAVAHFEALIRFETDCWDVHEALTHGWTASSYSMCAVRKPMHKVM